MEYLLEALEYSKHGKCYLFRIGDYYMLVLREKNIGKDTNRWFIETSGLRLIKYKSEICYLVSFFNLKSGKIISGYLYYDERISLGENWEQENYYWDNTILHYIDSNAKKMHCIY